MVLGTQSYSKMCGGYFLMRLKSGPELSVSLSRQTSFGKVSLTLVENLTQSEKSGKNWFQARRRALGRAKLTVLNLTPISWKKLLT